MRELLRHNRNSEKAQSKSVSTSISRSNIRGQYNKISSKDKAEFIRLITNQNYTIKQSAEQLDINYSSAKSIFMTYRRQAKKKHLNKYLDFQELENAGYRTCTKSDVCSIMLSNSIGGVQISDKILHSFQSHKDTVWTTSFIDL